METALATPSDAEARGGSPAVPAPLSKQIPWSGVLQSARGPCHCTIADLSRGGARVTVGSRFSVGQAVTLVVTGLGLFRGTVIWEEPGTLGVQFAQAQSASAA